MPVANRWAELEAGCSGKKLVGFGYWLMILIGAACPLDTSTQQPYFPPPDDFWSTSWLTYWFSELITRLLIRLLALLRLFWLGSVAGDRSHTPFTTPFKDPAVEGHFYPLYFRYARKETKSHLTKDFRKEFVFLNSFILKQSLKFSVFLYFQNSLQHISSNL